MRKVDINLHKLAGGYDDIQSNLSNLSYGLNNSGFKEFMNSLGSELGLTQDCYYAVQCLEAAAAILIKSRDYMENACNTYSGVKASYQGVLYDADKVWLAAVIAGFGISPIVIEYAAAWNDYVAKRNIFEMARAAEAAPKEILNAREGYLKALARLNTAEAALPKFAKDLLKAGRTAEAAEYLKAAKDANAVYVEEANQMKPQIAKVVKPLQPIKSAGVIKNEDVKLSDIINNLQRVTNAYNRCDAALKGVKAAEASGDMLKIRSARLEYASAVRQIVRLGKDGFSGIDVKAVEAELATAEALAKATEAPAKALRNAQKETANVKTGVLSDTEAAEAVAKSTAKAGKGTTVGNFVKGKLFGVASVLGIISIALDLERAKETGYVSLWGEAGNPPDDLPPGFYYVYKDADGNYSYVGISDYKDYLL